MPDLQVGDVGVVFEVTILQNGGVMDVSSASTKQLVFKSPSGAVLTKTAAFSGTGVDGKIRYTSLAADFTESGNWAVQGRVVVGAQDLKSSVGKFSVGANL